MDVILAVIIFHISHFNTGKPCAAASACTPWAHKGSLRPSPPGGGGPSSKQGGNARKQGLCCHCALHFGFLACGACARRQPRNHLPHAPRALSIRSALHSTLHTQHSTCRPTQPAAAAPVQALPRWPECWHSRHCACAPAWRLAATREWPRCCCVEGLGQARSGPNSMPPLQLHLPTGALLLPAACLPPAQGLVWRCSPPGWVGASLANACALAWLWAAAASSSSCMPVLGTPLIRTMTGAGAGQSLAATVRDRAVCKHASPLRSAPPRRPQEPAGAADPHRRHL